jgi:hypothetical protein
MRTSSNSKLFSCADECQPSTTTSGSFASTASSSYTDTDSNNNHCKHVCPKQDASECSQQLPELRRVASASIKYGELVVLGYNGAINSNNPRRKSKYALKRRETPNGVKPTSQHVLQSPQEADVNFAFFNTPFPSLHP